LLAGIFVMENQNEIWKDVVGTNGDYMVSSTGIVISLKFGKIIIKKQTLAKGTYLVVSIFYNGKQKSRKVHQLVAEAFLGHTPCGMELVVNHIDFNKQNNKLENLEIVTSRENSNLKHIKSTSIYTGVSWDKKHRKWKSTININGKQKYLGSFDSEIEASEYYEKALFNHNNNIPIEKYEKKFTSKFKGVYWDINRNKWNSMIRINNKRTFLGRFTNEIDAHNAYQQYVKDIKN